jgi:hypothetical protein
VPVEKVPEDRNARRTFLEEWAKGQRTRLAEEERLRRKLGYAQQMARVAANARERTDSLGEIPVVITKPSDLPIDRAAVFADLMAGLREHKWADPIVSECDEPRYIAPTAIELARRHRPEAPWLLYMEDDVVLGPHFDLLPELLREAGEHFPETGVVSFFSGSGTLTEPGWSILPIEHFGWLQCVAIRNTEFLLGFRAFIGELAGTDASPTQRTRPKPRTDRAVGAYLASEYDTFALWCPSLVQHADLASVFSGPQRRRISWSYRQAYGRLDRT